MAAEFSAELPAMADREIPNRSRSRRCDSFTAIHRSNVTQVAIGKARDCRDIVSCLNLGAIPAKVFNDISSVAEVIHNVAEITSVREPQRVAEFVYTRQVDDTLAKKCVSSGASRNVFTQRIYVRADKDGRSLPALDHNRPRFPVLAAVRPGPVNSNECV
jgi:hypothetical protein